MMFDPTRLANRMRIERWWAPDLPWYRWPLWLALTPPSLIYSAAMSVRSATRRFRRGKRRAETVKVISVGNLTVGGNGKTPFTLFLARILLSRGLRVGIVSRGYGGSKGSGEAQLVSDMREPRLAPDEAGDEAVMMAKFFDGPIAIAANRLDAIRLLESLGPLDAVVLDDGFQQLSLEPDINLVVVNVERGLGNGWVLPAGPMRERLGAVDRADAVILLSADANGHSALTPAQMTALSRRKIFTGRIRPRTLVQHDQGTWREVPLAGPFNLLNAALSGVRAPFLGDYHGLVASHDIFLAFFAVANSGDLAHSSSIFATSTARAGDTMSTGRTEINRNPLPYRPSPVREPGRVLPHPQRR